MKRIRILFLLIAETLAVSHAADWYLDSAASGSNSGTSWANAWVNPTNVVWGASGVQAGDTLMISGGSSSKSYTSTLTVGASGVSGSNITIRVSQEASHNGIAILPQILIGTRQFIVVDGSRSASFTPPTSVLSIDAITNNTGLRITITNSDGIYMNGAGGKNVTIKWVEIGPIGTTNNVGDVNGIKLLNLDSITNLLVEYCWIHDIQNDGINLNSVTTQPTGFDQFRVRWSLIEMTGDDGIQSVRDGFTLANSYLRNHETNLYNGHPDHLQLSGASSHYMKIVNNVFQNKANSLIIGEHLVEEGDALGPLLVAGNLFANKRDWVWNSIQAYGATFAAWRANASTSVVQAAFSNVYVLNNTFYLQRTTPFEIGRAQPSGSTRSVWRLDMYGAVQNNLFVDCKTNSLVPAVLSLAGGDVDGQGTNGVFYGTNQFKMTHNIVAGPNRSAAYNGVITNSAAWFGNNNGTNMPDVDITDYTLRPSATDTVVRDQGVDLSALTNQFPELMFDLNGNPRGGGSGWDIGASESQSVITDGLVMRFDFSDDMTDGIVNDLSPTGNVDGLRFGRLASPTNWPTATTFTNPISGDLLTAANFEWYPNDGYGDYGKSGDYIGVTNVTALKGLPAMTVTLWHLFENTYGNTNWTPDNNATLIAGDFGERGNWMVGRHGNDFPVIIVYTNNDAAADFEAGYLLDRTFSNPYGYSRTWKHIAFTWTNQTLVTYSNAVPLMTNTLSTVTNLTVRNWLGLGCLTHGNHDPELDNGDGYDQWPNNGWLNGKLADVRIYNRALDTNEIGQIYRNDEFGGGSGGGEEGGGGGQGGPLRVTAQNAIIGRISGP